MDIDNDKKISAKEMQRWIMEKTDEHFQEAVEENKMHFRAVDPDGDGKISISSASDISRLFSQGFSAVRKQENESGGSSHATVHKVYCDGLVKK